MTYTLSTLLSTCRNLIGDLVVANYQITDGQLTTFINLAINELNQFFPRRLTSTLTTTLNTRAYDLAGTVVAIHSVEFPTGENPPRYLTRRSYTNPLFWQVDGFYDFIRRDDQDSSNPPQLLISEKPAAGQTITLEQTADHNQLSDSNDETTILDRHVGLIPLFVRWKAWSEISTLEGMDTDPLAARTYPTKEHSVQAAEQAYRASLAQALAAEAESGMTPWCMDRFDRIY